MHTLTKAEEQVMQIIWQKGPCMVREVLNELGDPEIPLTTIASVVRVLEKKGFLGHKAYGKTYEYFPLVAKEDFTRGGIKMWINKYFDGSPQQLVSFLVAENELELKDLDHLMQQLESLKKK